MDTNRVKSGGAYLVDLSSGISPEISGVHYCYAFKISSDKDLFLCFIMSSQPDRIREPFAFSLPENPSGIILLKHTKIISRNRFLNTLKDNRNFPILLSCNSIKQLFMEYLNFYALLKQMRKLV